MGKLVDGEWHTDLERKNVEDGEYKRVETTFRDWIRDGPNEEFTPDPDRYHLYVCASCPWAHRTLLIRELKGLTDVISVDYVDPVRYDNGWQFSPEKAGCTPDTVNGCSYLYEIYAKADPGYTGRVSVPVLWDSETGTIVNNESPEILRMLDTEFDEYATRDVSFYPEGYRDLIDRTIDEIYGPINDGVYRVGNAETQEAYENAVADLFDALDEWERTLEGQRYLCGDVITEADICMYTTLVRFDVVYYIHYKCSKRTIRDYFNLHGYLSELYQLPAFQATTNFDHITEHYYVTHSDINPKQIIPVEPDLRLSEPHGRGALAGGPPVASQ